MTPPTIYTEATLAAFMIAELGQTGSALGLTNAASFTEAVNDAMVEYGVTDISTATNIKKIRAIAKYMAWKTAMTTVASDYNYSEGVASFSRGSMIDSISKRLSLAEQEAMPYLSTYTIGTATLDFPQNPYKRFNLEDMEA